MSHDGREPLITVEAERPEGSPLTLAGDRESLEHWLEFYRERLLWKLSGLSAEQLCVRAVPPSNLSLLGLLRHLTRVEQFWFTEVVAGTPTPRLYRTEEHPDGDIDLADPAGAVDDLAAYHSELARCRRFAATVTDLDVPLPGRWRGRELNLRWVYTHLIEEYARHLGHADLLREVLDGATGY